MALYGDYLRVKPEDIPKAKELLTEQAVEVLRELAKEDAFWIVKQLGGEFTVGYKIGVCEESAELCDGCRWKGKRPQRCSCCRRNRYLKDGYEEG